MPDFIPEVDPGLDAFAASLRRMLPSATQIRPDEVIFEAGRSSVSPRYQYLWQGVAAGFALLSLGLGYRLYERPIRTVTVERSLPASVERVEASPQPSPPRMTTTIEATPVQAIPVPTTPTYPYDIPALPPPVVHRSMWEGVFSTNRMPASRSPLHLRQEQIRRSGDLPALPSPPASMPDLVPDDDLDLLSMPGGILGSPIRRH